MSGADYTPERVKAILRDYSGKHSREEWIDVWGVVDRLACREGDVGVGVLLLWGKGWGQREALTQLGVKGRASEVFRDALKRVADELNGRGTRHEVRGIGRGGGQREDGSGEGVGGEV